MSPGSGVHGKYRVRRESGSPQSIEPKSGSPKSPGVREMLHKQVQDFESLSKQRSNLKLVLLDEALREVGRLAALIRLEAHTRNLAC